MTLVLEEGGVAIGRARCATGNTREGWTVLSGRQWKVETICREGQFSSQRALEGVVGHLRRREVHHRVNQQRWTVMERGGVKARNGGEG